MFAEACEIFLRLVRGDTLASADVRETWLSRANFRSDEDWERVKAAAGDARAENIQIDDDGTLMSSRSPTMAPRVRVGHRQLRPSPPRGRESVHVKVFNLSITQPEVIDATHERMARCYHPDGGTWTRPDMPRPSWSSSTSSRD